MVRSAGSVAPLLALVLGMAAAPSGRTLDGQAPVAMMSHRTANTSSFALAAPRVSFWKHPQNRNMMRLEEWPNGELRFWAHQLDPDDDTTRKVLAKQGLEIDVEQMTSEYVLRFCGFGYENGLRYLEAKANTHEEAFNVVVSVGFDYFRGVENPRYGDTRWRVSMRRIGDSTLHIDGRLIGWRGLLTFGMVRAEADLVRIANPPEPCTPSPIYAVKPPRRVDTSARAGRGR